jgi:hypothetical protein
LFRAGKVFGPKERKKMGKIKRRRLIEGPKQQLRNFNSSERGQCALCSWCERR